MHYKTPDNSLYFLSSEDVANGGEKLLPTGCVQITDQEAEAIRAENTPPVPVPQMVTMRQARLALLEAGLLQAVNTAIETMQGVEGEAARIEWDYSSEVHRDKALVRYLAPILGLTDQQLDDLFILAATL